MRRCATTLEAEMTANEHQLLTEVLLSTHGRGTHLEIGTAAGGTLCTMMGVFDQAHRPPFAVVDSMKYFPNQLETVKQNLEHHGINSQGVDFRVDTSETAFSKAEAAGDRFDFVLIDGCHKIRAVTTDLKWTRLVNVGGIVCLHDYTAEFPGVTMSVDRFLRRNKNYERIGLADSLIALRKTAPSIRPEIDSSDELYALAWYLPLQIHKKLNRRKAA